MDKTILKQLADQIVAILQSHFGNTLYTAFLFRVLQSMLHEAIDAGLFDLLVKTAAYQKAAAAYEGTRSVEVG